MKNTSYKLFSLVGMVAMVSSGSAFAAGGKLLVRPTAKPIERPLEKTEGREGFENKFEVVTPATATRTGSGVMTVEGSKAGALEVGRETATGSTSLLNSCKNQPTTMTVNFEAITQTGLRDTVAATLTRSSMDTPFTSIIVANAAKQMAATITATGSADPLAVEGAQRYFAYVQAAEEKLPADIQASVRTCISTGVCDVKVNERAEDLIVSEVKAEMKKDGFDDGLNDQVAACAGEYGVKVRAGSAI